MRATVSHRQSDTIRLVQNGCAFHDLELTWEAIKDLAQYKDEEWDDLIFHEKESLDYIDANLEQLLASMEGQVESLKREEMLMNFIVDQEDQIKELEARMRKAN
ncbi:hypothetical protein Tco_1323302 [Tanacetum coccineum]